jgi:hypothetical protein
MRIEYIVKPGTSPEAGVQFQFNSREEIKVFTATTALSLYKSVVECYRSKGHTKMVIHNEDHFIILQEALKYYLSSLDNIDMLPNYPIVESAASEGKTQNKKEKK